MSRCEQSASLPRSVGEAQQAVSDHQGQVNSIISELTVDGQLTELIRCSTLLTQQQDVRYV